MTRAYYVRCVLGWEGTGRASFEAMHADAVTEITLFEAVVDAARLHPVKGTSLRAALDALAAFEDGSDPGDDAGRAVPV